MASASSGGCTPLTISVDSLADYLLCPVCMSEMEKTCTTPCGHRYCYKCIRECIDRHHRCPCCNKKLKPEHLIRDPHFDDLIATICKEREASERIYFESLVEGATRDDPLAPQTNISRDPALAPLEEVMTKHLKQSMLSHQQYFQDLKREFERSVEQLKISLSDEHGALNLLRLTDQELAERKDSLQLEFNRDQQALKSELEKCTRMVADALDRHLTEHIPKLSILPVTLTVNLLTKGVRLDNIVLKPHHRMGDLVTMIHKEVEMMGDKVISMDDVKFIHFGHFSKRSTSEMQHIASDIILHGATHPDIYILPPHCQPVLQFNMKSGCEIAVYGPVQCESDLPKRCFVNTFVEAGPTALKRMDYFKCTDCNFNSHNIEPYILNHQPTWACCYCAKKKKCIIKE